MAKGQESQQKKAEQRSDEQYADGRAATQRQVAGSPELNARKQLVSDRNKAITSGTISESPDFLSNKAAVAKRAEDYKARLNLTKTGIAGMASNYADPTQVALANKVYEDEFARDSAAQAEDDARNHIAETRAMENDLIQTQINVNSGIMNSAYGVSQSQQQLAAQIASQRNILPAIIGAAISGASSVATAGMTGGVKKPI